MSLTSCIKKAGGALSPSDKSTILARARELRSDGMAANDAAIAAVDELLAHVQELVRGANGTHEAPPLAQEPTPDYTGGYETDLFGDQLPPAMRKAGKAKPAVTGLRGDVQPAGALRDTPAPEGEYHVNTIVGSEVNRELGATRITRPEHAAQATRYLYKSAVERFDGIVTDKDGKPLAVVGGFKGALTQASVYPATLMGEAIRIPGAANIWFSHNHPSGSPNLSQADKNLNAVIGDVFRGSGIEPRGVLAIGGDKFGYVGPEAVEPNSYIGDITPSTHSMRVPVVERTLVSENQAMDKVSDPRVAKDMAAVYYRKAGLNPGLLLLDSQSRVTAWVPIPKAMTGALRGTGQLAAIYRAVSQANAGSAIIVHGGELDAKIDVKGNMLAGVTASENIAAALSKIDVRALDSINVVANTSAAESGLSVQRGPVFSRPTPDEKPTVTTPTKPENTTDALRAALVKRFGNQIARLEKRNFLKIWPSTQAFNDGQNSRLEGPAQGYWDGKTAHLFADGIAPGNEVAVLLHEVGEHASMEAMLGPRHYGRLVDRAYDLLEKGDDSAVRAMDRIPDDTPAVHKDSEFLAYMIETVAADGAQATPGARKWLADIVAAIRAWFATTGLNKTLERYGQGIELTPADIAALAARAVAWQAEQDGASGRSTKSSMATNNVVGNNQGGRSADDISPALIDVEKSWESKGIQTSLYEKNGIITLSKIIVPKDSRNQGIGTAAMRELMAYADKTKQQIALTPSSDFGGNKLRLNAFYRGLGFRTYKGFAVRETLIRDPESPAPDTRYSRKAIVGQTNRKHTPEQLRAMHNVGFQVDTPTVKERAQALWKDAGKKVAQGLFDQFAPVEALDGTAYGLLRLSKGASGAFESFLHGGKLKLTGNVYDFDDTARGGVIDKLLIPLQGEHHDFMRWVAANRAERLAGEGREKLFTPQDIADLKTLADGNTGFDYTIQTGPMAGTVTRNRKAVYADALRVFNEFNKNILDMAEQSGLIDAASRKLWEHEFYVPFYRVADENDGGIRGANIKGGVVRQEAFKALKGGKSALNADLLDNTLMNWAHLLDASAKNRAAKATIEAAERMGVAAAGNQFTLAQMATSINNKHGVVWFMDQGVKRYSLIDDPYIMTALTALEFAGMRNPVMNAMVAFKHVLTVGVTASPYFKVRNLIRDSVQVLATSSINPNPVANIAKGWALTSPKSDAYFRLLAGGGTIHFGTMLEGSEAKRVQALVESGIDDATLLNGEHKVRQFYRKFIEPSITAYNELGNRGEAINRASLYDQLIRQGVSHADASLQARDLMDFSMNGSFTTIRFLTQTVPFLNARLQGLYKLGRAAKEDPARFSAVLGAVTIMSLGLLAAYGDDDDWKKREEWDRNNYWWFKFGGTAFRIPKPFEIGAIATLAERGFELAFDKEMTTTRFRKQVLALLEDNLSMNPVPQLIKPIVDVYANKDSFSGRPIETLSMERLKSKYRFTDRTTMVARAASTGLNAVTGLVGAEALSPVQIDHMLRGYFGWLGAFVVGSADVALRPATGQPTRTKPDYWKTVTGGIVSDLSDAPSRYVTQMYEQAKEIEQAYGTWRALQKEGKQEEARKFADDNREKIAKYRRSNRAKHMVSRLNERIRAIERSDMAGDLKRLEIRKIQERKDRAARMVLD